jgi:hypothetical protein
VSKDENGVVSLRRSENSVQLHVAYRTKNSAMTGSKESERYSNAARLDNGVFVINVRYAMLYNIKLLLLTTLAAVV